MFTQLAVPALVSRHIAFLVSVDIDLCRNREWVLHTSISHYNVFTVMVLSSVLTHRWHSIRRPRWRSRGISACCLDVNICSVVFWLGDLNYRMNDIDSDVCKQMITKGQLEQLLKNNDQVSSLFCFHLSVSAVVCSFGVLEHSSSCCCSNPNDGTLLCINVKNLAV